MPILLIEYVGREINITPIGVPSAGNFNRETFLSRRTNGPILRRVSAEEFGRGNSFRERRPNTEAPRARVEHRNTFEGTIQQREASATDLTNGDPVNGRTNEWFTVPPVSSRKYFRRAGGKF